MMATDDGWRRYHAVSDGAASPRPTLTAALAARDEPPGDAVDPGCGAGRDALALLAAGWRVYALDADPEALARVRALVPVERRDRLTLVLGRFEAAALPPSALVNAGFALPFCVPGLFAALWRAISASLRPGGIFCGHLFGVRDTWAVNQGMTFHTRPEVEALLAGWDVLDLQEREYDGLPALGPGKHWHLFHVVARRERDG